MGGARFQPIRTVAVDRVKCIGFVRNNEQLVGEWGSKSHFRPDEQPSSKAHNVETSPAGAVMTLLVDRRMLQAVTRTIAAYSPQDARTEFGGNHRRRRAGDTRYRPTAATGVESHCATPRIDVAPRGVRAIGNWLEEVTRRGKGHFAWVIHESQCEQGKATVKCRYSNTHGRLRCLTSRYT